jgi:cobalt/nickel transport system permease protein
MLETGTITDSLIERLDPRIKIVLVLLFSTLTAVSQKLSVILFVFAISLIAFILANIPMKDAVKRLIPVNMFILFLWFFLPFTVKGDTIFSISGLPISQEGIHLAAMITLKSNVIMVILIVLILSTQITTIAHAMHELKVPNKLVHIFFFTIRYIHVIHNEYLRLSNSMKIRSFKPKTNFHTYRTYAYMVGILLVRSLDRAKRVNQAMRCRGFNGNLYSLSTFSIRKTDKLIFISVMLLILFLGIMEWTTIISF